MSSENKVPNTPVADQSGGCGPQGDSELHASPLRHPDLPEKTLRKKNTRRRGLLAAVAFVLVAFTGLTIAATQEQEKQKPSSEADIRAALFGGVPMGRWKEGLMFQGVSPQPWLKSASNWFPRTEDVQPNEMRVIFMGSAPFIRPGQMNTSILVQLGNGQNFIFDLGEGSVANYIASGFALNELDKVLHHTPTRRPLRRTAVLI